MVKSILDRDPPFSIESERAFLGAMVCDPANITEATGTVGTPEMFYREAHATIWRTLLDLGDNADPASLVSRLESSRVLEQVGGVDYVTDIVNGGWSPGNWPHYAKVIRDRYRLRELIASASDAIGRAYDCAEGDVSDLIDGTLGSIARIATVGSDLPVVTMAEANRRIDNMLGKEPETRPCSVPHIDSLLGGLPKRGLFTVIGHPGGGKTTWALGAVLGAAKANPIPVRVVSYEQDAIRTQATLLSIESGQQIHGYLNTGEAPGAEAAREISEAMSRQHPLDFAMVDRSIDAPAIYREIATTHARTGPGIVMVDYIQNLPGFGAFQEATPKIEESCRILASIARDFGWLVVMVSQPDKASSKHNSRPTAADAKGSSAIQQASDFIVYVWREHQQEPCPASDGPARQDWIRKQRKTEIGVVKNKYGKHGAEHVALDTKRMAFREPDAMEREAWGISPDGSVEHERR